MTTVASIDGGKSGLRIRISGPECELTGDGPGFVYAGSSEDIPTIVAAVRVARDDAFRRAPEGDVPELDAAVVGLTGIPGDPGDRARLTATLQCELGASVVLVEDSLIGHAGALGGAGTVVSVGTGCITLAISADGTPHRADGWGPTLGDRGSAHAIGIAGMQAATRALDGVGPATRLTAELADTLGGDFSLPNLQTFYRASTTVVTVSAFARRVGEAAAGGDAVAAEILRTAAGDLADTIAATATHAPGLPISYSGRMLHANTMLRDFVADALDARGLSLAVPRGDALEGGLRLARSAVNPDPELAVYTRTINSWRGESAC